MNRLMLEEYVKLLNKEKTTFSDACIFYLKNKDRRFDEKKKFIFKVLKTYFPINGEGITKTNIDECFHKSFGSIPEKLVQKILTAYDIDLEDLKNMQTDSLVAEVDEIWKK